MKNRRDARGARWSGHGPVYRVFRGYMPVVDRRARGKQQLRKLLRATRRRPAPIVIDGRKMTRTFWGTAWCKNLERYSDFASRLPRGRMYVRNGSVLDLQIEPGVVKAHVAGYDLYTVEIAIAKLPAPRWRSLIAACTGRIGSLIALLHGELSSDVLAILTNAKPGLFPAPREIEMHCSCPDLAYMCKHIAAALYGVGARLDEQPGLFFTLRQVSQTDLIAGRHTADALTTAGVRTRQKRSNRSKRIGARKVQEIFGIALGDDRKARGSAVRPRTPRREKKVTPRWSFTGRPI